MDFLVILKTILLGIVEGITEFLPISSTGHIIIVEKFIELSKNTQFVNAFLVIVQLGAILAVVYYYWSSLWPFSGDRSERKEKWVLWSKVCLAVIPAAILGVLFDDIISNKLFSDKVVAVTLILYGVILVCIEKYQNKNKHFPMSSIVQITYRTALLIGFFQCLAMVPGTSRSAATIIGAMLLGVNRSSAAKFSFFLAIPTMFGATFVKLYKQGVSFTQNEWIITAVGFVVSFLMALIAIHWFMDYIKKHDFKIFGYYRIILGIAVLALLFLLN